MKQQVIVLGAGMVGTCTALHLALRGHEVTLVDRREPARETSYGNAGLIQREAVEPYPFPSGLSTLIRVAARRGADVHYHLGALPGIASRLAAYWSNSRERRYGPLALAYGRLIAGCLDEHQALITAAGADDLVTRQGYRWVFRDGRSLEQAVERARRLQRDEGVRHQVLDTAALAQAEPGLKARLPGGIHWLDTWSVSDPGELGRRYAQLLQRHGGRLARGDAFSLHATPSGWRVQTEDGPVEAASAVVALGPWSATLTERLGYRYPLFVKRGYHRHYRRQGGPQLAVLDADRGYVLAPMAAGVRLTTGAEFAHIDAPPTPVQMGRAEVLARELFDLGPAVEDTPWLGARPCTADMLPVIGPAPQHRGLWFNFGHAHQGFTLGPVSGRLMADLIEGRPPAVDPAPYAPARFG